MAPLHKQCWWWGEEGNGEKNKGGIGRRGEWGEERKKILINEEDESQRKRRVESKNVKETGMVYSDLFTQHGEVFLLKLQFVVVYTLQTLKFIFFRL